MSPLQVTAALFFGATCLMLLGFASTAGGLANYSTILADQDGLSE